MIEEIESLLLSRREFRKIQSYWKFEYDLFYGPHSSTAN